MTDGAAVMAEQIARLRALPKELLEQAARDIAPELERELRAQIARGVGPDGKPWPPTQAGDQALPNAARALSVRATGTVVLARLDGVHALHHLGRVRGGVRRQILPTGALPDPFSRAIKRVLELRFASATGGAR